MFEILNYFRRTSFENQYAKTSKNLSVLKSEIDEYKREIKALRADIESLGL